MFRTEMSFCSEFDYDCTAGQEGHPEPAEEDQGWQGTQEHCSKGEQEDSQAAPAYGRMGNRASSGDGSNGSNETNFAVKVRHLSLHALGLCARQRCVLFAAV